MDFFSFNYKPKDFKGKSTKDILAMKPNKVGDDFFTKYAEEIKTLSEDEINAVQLLSDLKDKTKILEKCYTKRGHQSVVPGHKASPQVAAAQPAVATQAADLRELVPKQTGGRGKRSGSKRSGGKRTRKSKRSGSKRSGGKRTRKSKCKRGGALHPLKL